MGQLPVGQQRLFHSFNLEDIYIFASGSPNTRKTVPTVGTLRAAPWGAYFENLLAPATQRMTAMVTPSIPMLTCSCSSVAASAKPKKGCNN